MILVEYSCPLCRKFLTWASEKAVIQCPHCTRWVYGTDALANNSAKMDTESDQMILF